MLMDTRNEEKHVPSSAYNSKEKFWKQMMTQEPTPNEGKPSISGRVGR